MYCIVFGWICTIYSAADYRTCHDNGEHITPCVSLTFPDELSCFLQLRAHMLRRLMRLPSLVTANIQVIATLLHDAYCNFSGWNNSRS